MRQTVGGVVDDPARPPAAYRLPDTAAAAPELVDHPAHYNAHPSGIECIQVVQHMGFNIGNAIKYLWRADEKGNALEDLRKAKRYIDFEIARRQAAP